MIRTNHDLAAMQRLLDSEILRLQTMAKSAPEQTWIKDRLVTASRQRIAICATLVNRRAEAAKKVVVFSRWVSGAGALAAGDLKHPGTVSAEAGWRRQHPM